MHNTIAFACRLEEEVNSQLGKLQKQELQTLLFLQPIFALFLNAQLAITELVAKAAIAVDSNSSYPAVELTLLLGADQEWTKAILEVPSEQAHIALPILWQATTLLGKSGQFYKQAALNAAYPEARLFFSSLSEVKNIMQARTNGILQMVYNAVWSQIGFAPFVFGKD